MSASAPPPRKGAARLACFLATGATLRLADNLGLAAACRAYRSVTGV